MLESNHMSIARSRTIQDSHSSKTIFNSLSLCVLNMDGICGVTTTLWSLSDEITPSTYWFHIKNLFSWSLMESFGATCCPILNALLWASLLTKTWSHLVAHFFDPPLKLLWSLLLKLILQEYLTPQTYGVINTQNLDARSRKRDEFLSRIKPLRQLIPY